MSSIICVYFTPVFIEVSGYYPRVLSFRVSAAQRFHEPCCADSAVKIDQDIASRPGEDLLALFTVAVTTRVSGTANVHAPVRRCRLCDLKARREAIMLLMADQGVQVRQHRSQTFQLRRSLRNLEACHDALLFSLYTEKVSRSVSACRAVITIHLCIVSAASTSESNQMVRP